eukprot:gene2556-4140_t
MGLTSIYDDDECTKALEDKDYWPLVWGPYGRFPDTVDGCSIRFGNNAFRNDKGQCKVGTKTPDWIPGVNSRADCLCSEFTLPLQSISCAAKPRSSVSERRQDLVQSEARRNALEVLEAPFSTLSFDKTVTFGPYLDQDNEWVSLRQIRRTIACVDDCSRQKNLEVAHHGEPAPA